MKKCVNNSLWLFGGIILGSAAASNDTTEPVQASEPVAVVAKAEPVDRAKVQAAKDRLEAAKVKLAKAEARAAEIEENDRIMNADTPLRPSALQITLCQMVIQDDRPDLTPIKLNVSTSALVPDTVDKSINAVWFQFEAGSDRYTAKCNIKGVEVLNFKYEKSI